ncbi:MAG: pantoate--beta-alanine ligase [Clostridiales Family XIII bacterium]|nr:pantoate--beta-alanine ligase [Clostridiales Family XIII bacterium]
MPVVETIGGLREQLAVQRKSGKSIGLVPTMGALHAGHRSLIEKSAAENDITVVSIFVNPIQFGPNEDLDKYPKSFDADVSLCTEAGAGIIFHPTPSEMYPDGFSLYVDSDAMTDVMCGRSRPGHFRGVMTVVSKLFHIAAPDKAYFGEKDAQQLAIIQKMTRDLDFPVQIVGCPIVREADGLALSSRNTYLSDEERTAALCLYRALSLGKLLAASGERNPAEIVKAVTNAIGAEKLAHIDYVELLDAGRLCAISEQTSSVLLAVAAYFGSTRLIDNLTFEWCDRK